MATAQTLEERLEAVESDLAMLKRQLSGSPLHGDASWDSPESWYQQIKGGFKEFPEFAEVVRLGREFRENDIYSSAVNK